MTFDRSRFALHLHQPQWAEQLMWFQTTNSTNGVLSAQEYPEGTVAIAAQQTAGRGQWGRTWVSPIGGLYLSMAIAPDLPASQGARLTLASAWGIAKQLRNHHVAVQLKWPNDLYINGKKLGGILTETSVSHGQIRYAVVGVGINWMNQTVETGISIQDLPRSVESSIQSLEHLAALVVNGIDSGKQELLGKGLERIIPEYSRWLYQDLPEGLTLDDL